MRYTIFSDASFDIFKQYVLLKNVNDAKNWLAIWLELACYIESVKLNFVSGHRRRTKTSIIIWMTVE